MKLSNLDFKRLLFSVEPIKEIGIITLEPENTYIRFDYVNNVFINFDTYFKPSVKQSQFAKKYLNEFAENN